MTLTQLEYVLALNKYGSFKLAANHLKISQPALSLQVAKLEKEVGLQLFDRNQSPIVPTPEGLPFLTRAREIVISSEELLAFAHDVSDNLKGKLKIGIIPTLAPFLVPLFADSFQKKYPGITLDITEMITEMVVSGVREGHLDAGIISTPISAFGIESSPLFYEKFYLYSSEKPTDTTTDPLTAIDYSKLWLLDEGNCFRDQVNNFCDLNKIRKDKDFIYRSNSIDALIRIVDSKGGLTILPELTTLILSGEQEDFITEIRDEKAKAREIGLIKRNQLNKNSLIDEMASHIRESIPKSMLSSENLDVVDPNIHLD